MTLKESGTPRSIERVLGFVNKVRAKHKLKPLRKLPKGICAAPSFCPIARSLSGNYRVYSGLEPVDGGEHIPFPKYVDQFIDRFDAGRIPSLIIGK